MWRAQKGGEWISSSGEAINIYASRKARSGRGRDIRRRSPAAPGQRALAITVGKAARGAVRRLRRGNGTAIPGMAALAIDAHLLSGLASEIRLGTVIVTGTNGKGTTCRMLAGGMRASGLLPITHQEGANHPGGRAPPRLPPAGPGGPLPADDRAVGLFEVDEGSLPEV